MCYDKILVNVATFTKNLSQHITILYFIILIIYNFS